MTRRLAAVLAAIALVLAALPALAAAKPPDISASSAVLIEASTGEVLYARDAEQRRGREQIGSVAGVDDRELQRRWAHGFGLPRFG